MQYKMRHQRAGMDLVMYGWTISFFCDNTMVQVQFQVGGLARDEANVARRMAAYRPLATLIANTILLPDKYAPPQRMASPPLSPSRERNPGAAPALSDNPWQALTIGLLVTWGIGLGIPLLIRLVTGGPLSKPSATWVAGCFCALGWIGFRVLNASMGERPGTGAVWFLIFPVAQWLMSRGHPPLLKPAAALTPATATPPLGRMKGT
jgi:hypothetical protein